MLSFTGKPITTPQRSNMKSEIPAGLWIKCKDCGQIIYQTALENALQVCPSCGYHYPLTAWKRISLIADEGTFEEMDAEMVSADPLNFAGNGSYPQKIEETQGNTGLKDAVVCGSCLIDGKAAALGVMDFRFFGASMGSVVGEKVTRLIEYATRSRRGLVIISASGGARMQEGVLSLMQMAKTSAALMKLDEARLPYISVLTNPTTGGVTASFASLGDVIFAEPKALVGFAGPRVIKQTTKSELPEGFQTAEFLVEHGFIDSVVPRARLKAAISQVLGAWKGGNRYGR